MGLVDFPTKYTWRGAPDSEWRIGYGVSDILVAEGSAYGCAFGARLFKMLAEAEKDGVDHFAEAG